MVAATKILHIIEAFSTPWFLFSNPTNHHLIFFLLEVLNNIIQYQFDGNSNIIYSMIRKRQIFHDLSGLKSDSTSISQALSKKSKRAAKIAVMLPVLTSGNSPSGSFYTPQTPSSPISQRSASIESSSQMNSDVETCQLKASLEVTPSLQFTIDKSRPSSGGTPTINTAEDNVHSKTQHSIGDDWIPSPDWIHSWKHKLPLQTIMRLLQVLVPQVEKICIDKGLTDESEIIKFLQRGTLVGLLPVPHPILIRKYQSNPGTDKWFRTYMWGVIYLRNIDPPIWYDTNIQLFEIQRVTGNN